MPIEAIHVLQVIEIKHEWTQISHDREFVNGLANRIIEVKTNGSVNDYHGTYEDYLSSQGIE